MAVRTHAVAVLGEPTRLDSPQHSDHVAGESIALYNPADSGGTVWIGGDDVDADNGIPVPAGQWSPGLDLESGEGLWAVRGESTVTVRVIETGV